MKPECLAITEADAAWPAWLCAETTEVFAEHGSDDLLDRALMRVRELGPQLGSVIVVCGPELGTVRGQARITLLRALAAAVDFWVPEGRLVVVSDGDFATRQALAALVLDLNEDLESAQSTVSVRFRAQPRSSAPPRAVA